MAISLEFPVYSSNHVGRPRWAQNSSFVNLTSATQRFPRRKLHICSNFKQTDDPILNSITYKRHPSINYFEEHSTLEVLGMKVYSAPESRALAASEGLFCKLGVDETPVTTKFEVLPYKEGNSVLKGTVYTVLAVECTKCGVTHGRRLTEKFECLLSRVPVYRKKNCGTDLDKPRTEYHYDETIYFPDNAKFADLTKYIRDTIICAIPMHSLCRKDCKGICLLCRHHLNESEKCKCTKGPSRFINEQELKAAVPNYKKKKRDLMY